MRERIKSVALGAAVAVVLFAGQQAHGVDARPNRPAPTGHRFAIAEDLTIGSSP